MDAIDGITGLAGFIGSIADIDILSIQKILLSRPADPWDRQLYPSTACRSPPPRLRDRKRQWNGLTSRYRHRPRISRSTRHCSNGPRKALRTANPCDYGN